MKKKKTEEKKAKRTNVNKMKKKEKYVRHTSQIYLPEISLT